jgi:ABC-type phosphate transport system substrate-binding protein
MKKVLTLLLIIHVALIGNVIFAQSKGYKIIVNKANSVSSMTKDDVSKLLLKKDTKWSNGNDVIPVDLPEDAAARSTLTEEVHGRTVKAVVNFWRQKMFSGIGKPPEIKNSDSDVITFIKANVDAIGYVSENADVTSVKIVEIK